ncbi:hypothetical protein [Microbacterium sp. CGR1]|uniref:hypothetical protein n=1 Tax=Microbacterium sp. CGR1 TaxID=1696072 RepID=UPI003DA6AA86
MAAETPGAMIRREVFVGRSPVGTHHDSGPGSAADWAYTGMAVLLALTAVYLAFRGDLLVTVVFIAAGASIAAVEIDRRRIRPSNRGLLDALTGADQLVFVSRRGAARYGVLAVASALIGLGAFVLAVATPTASPVRGFALFALTSVLALVQGVRIIRASATAAQFRLDRAGVAFRSGARGGEESVRWDDLRGLEYRRERLSIRMADGRVRTLQVGYLLSDPAIVAEMLSRFADDPGSRALVGERVLHALGASPRWGVGATSDS